MSNLGKRPLESLPSVSREFKMHYEGLIESYVYMLASYQKKYAIDPDPGISYSMQMLVYRISMFRAKLMEFEAEIALEDDEPCKKKKLQE